MPDNSFLNALSSLSLDDNGEIFDDLINSLPFGVYLDDAVSGAIYANKYLLETWDLSWKEFKGFGWTSSVHKDDSERLSAAIAKLERDFDSFSETYRIVRKDKTDVWVNVYVEALLTKNGEHKGHVSIIRNVTNEREITQKLSTTSKMESIGKLAGGTSHDLNNILSMIQSSIDIMRLKNIDEKYHKHLSVIQRAVETGAQLTRNLLTISKAKPQSGSPCCPYIELEKLTPLLKTVMGEQIEITLNNFESMSTIPLDDGQFSQIVLNLSVNARDAMKGNGSLSINSTFSTGGYLLEISDTGGGVPDEHREHIFEPFYTTKAKQGGSGIGLSTIADIVRTVDGSMSFDTKLNEGTTFSILLPVLDSLRKHESDQTNSELVNPKSRSILLIENNPSIRNTLVYALALYGHSMEAAAGITEAKELLKSKSFDVIVSDVLVGDGNSIDLIKDVRNNVQNQPVVFISGYIGESDFPNKDVTTEFVSKPFKNIELLQAIERVCN